MSGAAALLARACAAHTDSLGFVCVQRGSYLFDVTVCYGSWHSDAPPAEGALSLYTAPANASQPPSLAAAYTEEAYGAGGAVRDATSAFRDAFDVEGRVEWRCDACGWPEAQTRGYAHDEIEAVGFTWGADYWYSDESGLHSNASGGRAIYKHQCATVGGVAVGTYRFDYDNDPAEASGRAELTANWRATGGLAQARRTHAVQRQGCTWRVHT